MRCSSASAWKATLVKADDPPAVPARYTAQVQARKNPSITCDRLTEATRTTPCAAERFTASLTRTQHAPDNVNFFDAFRADAALAGRVNEAMPIARERCTSNPHYSIPHCLNALRKIDHPEAVALRKELPAQRIAKLRQARQSDVANPQITSELASLLRGQGDDNDADRVLSELVEFSPHDYSARISYAQAFEQLKRPLDACATYAAAVQLDPAQRDTFRTMMSLRRRYEDAAKPLRDCVVQGVSNLPVTRDISLVLTWEDNAADVDLHIFEAKGEHISYQDRESEQGGLLYYDITDGYGPEIYVLGKGAQGKYKLQVVYYSGSQPNLKGTLTVLRNAGAANETREHHPFTLAHVKDEVDIVTLTL